MKLYLFSSTHWDREWYLPFQGFRFKLVQMVDDLIDGLETLKDYGVFHFDGQTIVLEDYLEIAPENRARIEALVKKGKMRIGPWYNMPDEYNVSGESLIKNLRRGHDISRQFGSEPMQLGYVCDIFGHTAQTPQIFAGFGINHINLGRGTIESETPTYFRWLSPDGTEAITWKINDPYGYGTLSVNACAGDPMADEEYRKRFKDVLDREMGRSDIPIVLLTDGQDHIPMRRNSSRYLELIRELYPGIETFHTAIEEVWKELDGYRDQMPVKQGELNRTSDCFGGLLTNTLSSRYDNKRANDMLQTRLEKTISPALAFGMVGCRDGFLRHAETFLLRCHPHDSICGCAVARVHQDMHYRFDQANLICDEIHKELESSIARGFAEPMEKASDHTQIVRIFNPLPYRLDGVQTITVSFPMDFPHRYAEPFGYEWLNCFRLYDKDEKEIPYGLVKMEKRGERMLYTLRVSVSLEPLGTTDLLVKPLPVRTRYLERMESDARSVDNGVIRVQINADGSMNITDKRTGRTYENLLTLLDDADIGDGWYHCNPVNTETVTNTSAVVSIVENNINALSFRVCVTMNVPARVLRDDNGIRRSSDDRIDMTVTHLITILRDSDRVTVQTEVDNTARDHRLKLRLPTGIEGDQYTASLPFCFTTRKTGVDMATQEWLEVGVAEKQNSGVVYKSDDKGGLAFLARYGFHECAVYENGTIDMTMMRCFGKTPNGMEEGGQLIGKWIFEYQLMPFTESKPDAMLQRAQDRLAASLICGTISGTKPQTFSFASLEGDTLCYSTADVYQGKHCIRLYNPTAQPVTDTLFVKGMTGASKIRLDGTHLEDLKVENNRVQITLRQYEIYTVAFETEK